MSILNPFLHIIFMAQLTPDLEIIEIEPLFRLSELNSIKKYLGNRGVMVL